MWTVKLTLLIVLLDLSLNQDLLSKFTQNDYKLKDHRGEVVSYNPDIVKYVKFKTFKYNRTAAVFNFSVQFLIDVEDKLEMVVQMYKFASNEYRHFPIRFQFKWLNAFNTNMGGFRDIKKCGNIQTIYFRKGINYYFCNFNPNDQQFPPYIPSGMYKSEICCLYNNIEAFTLNTYGEVYRPMAIPTN